MGLWQLSIAGLNFFNNGAHKATAQIMQAVLMGGAIHHHAVGENQPAASVGALAFLGLSTCVALCARPRQKQDARRPTASARQTARPLTHPQPQRTIRSYVLTQGGKTPQEAALTCAAAAVGGFAIGAVVKMLNLGKAPKKAQA